MVISHYHTHCDSINCYKHNANKSHNYLIIKGWMALCILCNVYFLFLFGVLFGVDLVT